jgi:DnaK suppressor protein
VLPAEPPNRGACGRREETHVTKTTASTPPAPAPAKKAAPAKSAAPAAAPKPVSARAAAKAAAAEPAPMPPATSRFADRFAPPRPPARNSGPAPIDAPRTPAKADPKLANAWKSKAGRDLTEPELLAMPESEYMNEKQLEFFRARLQALKDDLLSNAGETTEHLREDTTIVPDPADRATIEEEHALELRTRDRERKLLKKISQSLARIESGDYGFCDETGEPIGLARLIARPTATLSLEAQQRRELKQKMFGD